MGAFSFDLEIPSHRTALEYIGVMPFQLSKQSIKRKRNFGPVFKPECQSGDHVLGLHRPKGLTVQIVISEAKPRLIDGRIDHLTIEQKRVCRLVD